MSRWADKYPVTLRVVLPRNARFFPSSQNRLGFTHNTLHSELCRYDVPGIDNFQPKNRLGHTCAGSTHSMTGWHFLRVGDALYACRAIVATKAFLDGSLYGLASVRIPDQKSLVPAPLLFRSFTAKRKPKFFIVLCAHSSDNAGCIKVRSASKVRSCIRSK